MTLRTRLLVVTTLTLAAGMLVLCLAGNGLFAHTIAIDQQARLRARLDAIAASITITPAGRLHINTPVDDKRLDSDAWIISASGRSLESSDTSSQLSRTALALAHHPAVERTNGLELGVRTIRNHGKQIATVVAGVSIDQLESLRRDVLVGSILVTLVTLIGGAVIIRRGLSAALAPVDRMTRDADRWGAHELDKRFGLGRADDEISALAATLDRLLDRIASSRRHERRFAAEIAHELRTPLAAIHGTAELAASSTEPAQARAALAQVQTECARLSSTLSTLIAFSRGETNAAADGVDIEALARDFPDVIVTRQGPPLPRVEGDPVLIHRAMAPLVENARRYAAEQVTVELSRENDRATITVRDDGPGVATDLRSIVFVPGVSDDSGTHQGAGLGLPLARRIARSCGGDIALGQGPGGCFVLTLPTI